MNKVSSKTIGLVAGGACALMVTCVGLLGACTQTLAPGPGATGGPMGRATGHAIHVLAKRADGTTTQLNFGQATEATFTPQAIPTVVPTGTIGTGGGGGSSGISTAPGFSDAGTPIVAPPT